MAQEKTQFEAKDHSENTPDGSLVDNRPTKKIAGNTKEFAYSLQGRKSENFTENGEVDKDEEVVEKLQ